MNKDGAMPRPTLFLVGDSLIEFCDWQSWLTELHAINLGRAGETVGELLARLPEILALRPPPDSLLLMTGTNNVCREDFAFLTDYETILRQCRAALPDTMITVNSLLPIALPYLASNVTARLNSLLRELATRQGAAYLDAHAALTDAGGLPLAGALSPDGVHLGQRGYQLWIETLHTHLQSLSS